jgi:hypothetical protein
MMREACLAFGFAIAVSACASGGGQGGAGGGSGGSAVGGSQAARGGSTGGEIGGEAGATGGGQVGGSGGAGRGGEMAGASGAGEAGAPAGRGGAGPGGQGGAQAGRGGGGGAGRGGSAGGSAGAAGSVAGAGGQSGAGGTTSPGGCAAVTVNASGAYSVVFKSPSWTFSGNLGAAASGITTTTGADKLGSYCDTSFTHSASGSRSNRIRAYAATPVVIFSESSTAQVSNTRNFPKLTSVPSVPHHITYGGGGGITVDFINYSLTTLVPDSPFVYFDDSANTFIISGASHFTNTQTAASGGGITSGIQSNIATLPAGFEVSTILVADTSFNRAYESWGQALLSFTGKTLVGNDATPVLGKFGYWTDNGAAYYYKTQTGADYQTTLKNVVSYFKTNGVPLAYVQLDSWWYPKGATQSWSDTNGGYYTYDAQKDLFPNGLASFQQSLGAGLITHNRWLDTSSPYRTEYKCSGNQVIDPAFWADRASYLKSSGVFVYEQDWLSRNGLPNQNNLTDQDAFLDGMAKAMGDAGLDIQYCMPLARHIMQSTKYNSVTNSRVSSDRFASGNYMDFLHGSRFAWSVRLWPWTDVFMSTERENLVLSTLSAGLVGTGDAINGASVTNIKRVIRPDGVIVKPDVPVMLLDRSVVEDAKGGSATLVATTYTQQASARFTYVYAFRGGAATSVAPSELGYAGKVYVYDVYNDSGKAVDAAQAYAWGNGYYMIAPVGASGIALLGDRGKFVAMGKKRISAFADDGTITATVQYATGEGPVTLQGYAAAAPTVTATVGTVGSVSYSASTQRFSVLVTASGASATVRISP